MINLHKHDGHRPKCCFTSSVLPEFVNHEQLPAKKKPFSTISEHKINHTLTLVIPSTQVEDIKTKLEDDVGLLQYAKVYMKLSEVIEGDFFKQYIKSGNVLMISEGKSGLDNMFSLCEGVLRLEVDKATYERIGLDGNAIPSGGRKHVKTRYGIELNLRLPSMVRGKHGFERIVWAFKNVLNQSVTWLFFDMNGKNDGSGPIAQYQPRIITVKPESETLVGAQVPEPSQDIRSDDYNVAEEILEWLALATMCSPRIQRKEKIDTYLSKYQIPGSADLTGETMTCTTQDLVVFCWHGLVPATVVKDIALATLRASGSGWFGLTASGFGGRAYSILQRTRHTLTWEYAD